MKLFIYIVIILFAKVSLAQGDSITSPKLKQNSKLEQELLSYYINYWKSPLQMNGQKKEREGKVLQSVKITLSVNELGNPFSVKIVKSSNYENYDQAILIKFNKSEWCPATIANKPIASQIIVLIDEGCIRHIQLLSLNKNDALSITQPIFRGGSEEMIKFINKNKQYPKFLKDEKKIGLSIVKFLIDSTGKVSNVKIRQSSGYELFDIEAVRVASSMPNWIPALDGTHRISRYCDLTIAFGNKEKLQAMKESKIELSNKNFKEGMESFQSDKLSSAKEKYKKAYTLNCYHSDALYNLGVTYFKLNQKDSACYYWNELKVNFARKEADELIKKYCSN